MFIDTNSLFIPGDSELFSLLIGHANKIIPEDTIIYTDSVKIARLSSQINRNEAILLPGKIDYKTNRTSGDELVEFLRNLPIIHTAIFELNFMEWNKVSSSIGFQTLNDLFLARKIMLSEKRARRLIFISPLNVLKKKKSHTLEIQNQEIDFIVQAVYRDEEKQFNTLQVNNEIKLVYFNREDINIKHM